MTHPYRDSADLPDLDEWCDDVPSGPWLGARVEVAKSNARRAGRVELAHDAIVSVPLVAYALWAFALLGLFDRCAP